MLITVIACIVSLSVATKIARSANDPKTWKNSAETKKERGMIAWASHAALQVIGSLVLSIVMGVDSLTIVSVYQVLWTNMIEYILSYCIVSQRGLETWKTQGLKSAIRDSLKNMGTKSFQKSLQLIIMDMSIMSIILSNAMVFTNQLALPSYYPRAFLDFVTASMAGSAIQMTYGLPLRANWVHGVQESALVDGITTLLTILCTLANLGNPVSGGDESFLETRNGKLCIVISALVVSFMLNTAPKTPSGNRGKYVFLTATLITIAILAKQTKNKVTRPLLLLLLAPVVV